MIEIKATIKHAQLSRVSPDHAFVIIGEAYGHPDYPDGTTIRTSALQQIDFKRGLATTLNSTYVVQL